MKKLFLFLFLFGLIFNNVDAQRNYAAKKLLFSQVQKPYINYGYLYNWYAAIDSRNITSSNDWVVPTVDNYVTMLNLLGTRSSNSWNPAGYKLKNNGTLYWVYGGNNETLFNGRGGGERTTSGVYQGIRTDAWIRTSSLLSTVSYIITMSGSNDLAGYVASQHTRGYSIRLLYVGSGIPTSYTGNDGKIYRITKIGTQYWLADNLAETKYRNGDLITVVTDNAAWAALTTEARCVYNNDENNR